MASLGKKQFLDIEQRRSDEDLRFLIDLLAEDGEIKLVEDDELVVESEWSVQYHRLGRVPSGR